MRALIPLAMGVEEMEAVILADVLRRAGWNVVLAGLAPGWVTASRGVRLQPDAVWADVAPLDFDILILPGGTEGVAALTADERVLDAVRQFDRHDKWLAAICAAPLVLQAAGILVGRAMTCHPGVKDRITETTRSDSRVVVDRRLVTSQAAGTTFEFALALIRLLESPETADRVAAGLCLMNGSQTNLS